MSVQDLASHKKFREENNLNFPVLSDPTREVAARYGVLTAPDGVAKRVTYYIDPTGVVRKVDEKVQPFSAAKDEIAALKELQKGEPKPTLANSRAWNEKIRKASEALKKNPSDKAAQADLATAHYMMGRYIMQDDWVNADLRYPMALKHLNEALKVNPNLVAAKEDKAAIEAELKKAGKPLPSG